MTTQIFATTFARAAICATALCSALDSAVSAEFCVTCSAPDAQYRCAVSVDGALTAPAGAQLPCIRKLARDGGHKSCAVRRDPPAICDGQLIVLPPNPDQQIPADHPINHGSESTPETNVPANISKPDALEVPADESPKPAKPPKTVEELAKQTIEQTPENLKHAGRVVVDTAKQTGDQLKNAGEFVGSSAQTTWNCLTSFFLDCSGTAQNDPAPETDAQPASEEPPVEPNAPSVE